MRRSSDTGGANAPQVQVFGFHVEGAPSPTPSPGAVSILRNESSQMGAGSP